MLTRLALPTSISCMTALVKLGSSGNMHLYCKSNSISYEHLPERI